MDLELAAMPMPPEYRDQKMLVLCNDCSAMSEVPFHILGGKCRECGSYNTARADSAADKLKFEKQKSNKTDGGNGQGGSGEGDDEDGWQDLD